MSRKTAKSKLFTAALSSLAEDNSESKKNYLSISGKRSVGGDKFVIRGREVRIPPDFNNFLSDRDNKERMFKLIQQVWKNVAKLANCVLHFSRGSTYTRITRNGSVIVEDLVKDHEEADTKIASLEAC